MAQHCPPSGGSFNIGDAAAASGVSAKMIRHYESIGLIGAARRTEAGYRVYAEQDVRVLQFIHRGRALGFSLDQIRDLLALWQDKERASADVRALARTHIDELNRKIAEMEAMRRTLEALAASCHGDARSDCPILDDLAAH
ncbi:Cu(I)-responsive transcriptional regulator [Massilia sp. KIM]|uniref:Cu(I)-responsive transcriptional regulator n=1 Tax=Massilia sp. KIM TaxID=1955422 RepID=UPI00098FC8A8|nr:Cu(I)-responsive transcriptional regulator [Massilia sp. KIM]OON63422.1 Cu(I)-responsive transcriptional regulator [Massilia sp. KIM]